MSIAQQFKDRGIPVSLLVIDFLSWAFQGDWGLQQNLWPDPAKMAQQVKSLTGAELMASLWPSVGECFSLLLLLDMDPSLTLLRSAV